MFKANSQSTELVLRLAVWLRLRNRRAKGRRSKRRKCFCKRSYLQVLGLSCFKSLREKKEVGEVIVVKCFTLLNYRWGVTEKGSNKHWTDTATTHEEQEEMNACLLLLMLMLFYFCYYMPTLWVDTKTQLTPPTTQPRVSTVNKQKDTNRKRVWRWRSGRGRTYVVVMVLCGCWLLWSLLLFNTCQQQEDSNNIGANKKTATTLAPTGTDTTLDCSLTKAAPTYQLLWLCKTRT
jgi:hypothetical protein